MGLSGASQGAVSAFQEGCSKAYPVLEDQRRKLFEHVALMRAL